MTTYVFDGSFEGLLTAIFDSYDRRDKMVDLVWNKHYQPSMLADDYTVISDSEKAERVWAGLGKKLTQKWGIMFYKAYLSEDPHTFKDLFNFAHYIFDNPQGAESNFGNSYVMAVSKMDRKVNREKHRMKAFIRFQKTADGIYYCPVEPDFNVLPLISKFFKDRYTDQQWIIHDIKRKYGLFYNLHTVEEITYEFVANIDITKTVLPAALQDEKEALASLLWKDYFNSTNIPARKNMKLHIQHVPKRYWKYLNEKDGKN
ncbi:DNA metabolism protein [Flavobacterium akiainvivens]|uniref:DNA metabolism protein n=1 Tax=Flavobacterium akiainvivens TaxID=1202724 RepID=A0A0M9VIK1_9FLAO|nr:TIGR03915 family putative DNA repair protein [Flavobacterium akiainvivens]KOS06790.1 DNA metabolism protein [Flavobacterium akiainvivens]SFQ78049.1 probable DNA metabolism protein [Flavobacterium akiainvivens]